MLLVLCVIGISSQGSVMRIISILLLGFLMTFPVWANPEHPDVLLNKVKMNFSAEQWIATKTALVTVGVNASVNDMGLEKIQDEILQKLNKLSPGEWHIVSFDRALDQSGLEKVQISAEVRLPASALVGLREKTKAMSKPGTTFTLDNVRFAPSEDEVRVVKIALRNNIYQQAKEELERLNKLYPDQRYYVHDIDFINEMMPMAQIQTMRVNGGGVNAMALAVSNKMILNATVTLAAMPDRALVKDIT